MPAMHEIDYKIFSDDMQFVEVELDPDEATVADTRNRTQPSGLWSVALR